MINHHLLHLVGLAFICLYKMHGNSSIKFTSIVLYCVVLYCIVLYCIFTLKCLKSDNYDDDIHVRSDEI
jgi:Ca2+/Na+ antiporter